DGGAELARRGGIDMEKLIVERRRGVVAVEWKLARRELVEHHADRVEVRPDVGRIPRDLLGRDVAAQPFPQRRPGDPFRKAGGEPDVGDADRPGGGEKYIARLDAARRQAGLPRRAEAADDAL